MHSDAGQFLWIFYGGEKKLIYPMTIATPPRVLRLGGGVNFTCPSPPSKKSDRTASTGLQRISSR